MQSEQTAYGSGAIGGLYGSGAIGGYPGRGLQQANEISKQPRVTSAADRLESLVETLEKGLTIGHQHLERIAGSTPQAVSDANYKTAAEPPAMSQLHRIERSIERLRELVHGPAQMLVDRLGSI